MFSASGLASPGDRCGARVQRSVLCPFTYGSWRADTSLSLVALEAWWECAPGHKLVPLELGVARSPLSGCAKGAAGGSWGISGNSDLHPSENKRTPKGNASHWSFLHCKGDRHGVGEAVERP